MKDVEQLKALRSFLIRQAVSVGPEETMYFGRLNTLRRSYTGRGRYPTPEEWKLLEEYTQKLYGHLDESVRRRFLYGQIPAWITQTASALGVAALAALFGAMVVITTGSASAGRAATVIVPLYTVWLAALGAIGSISFIGMNALAVQNDATFDLTNSRLILMRIVLGALFGVVLTLPFGYQSFMVFLKDLSVGGADISSGLATQSILLLLPFILGFSTSLVIMILNQFVEAVQTFFGKRSGAHRVRKRLPSHRAPQLPAEARSPVPSPRADIHRRALGRGPGAPSKPVSCDPTSFLDEPR